jgi:hypothetical protein
MEDDDWQGLALHNPHTGDVDQHEALRVVTDFVARYARMALEDLRVYRQAAVIRQNTEPGSSLFWPESHQASRQAFEQVWMAGTRLIWSCFQAEKWYARHRQIRQLPRQSGVDGHLKTIRNTLEHLEENEFYWGGALGDPLKQSRSINHPDLGGHFPIQWKPSFTQNVLGYYDLDFIEARFSGLAEYDKPKEGREQKPPTL